MKELNEKVVELLNKELWWLGTSSDEPNVVPVGFKFIADDGKLVVADVFLNITLKNIEANSKIAISVCSSKNMTGYQIKGTAEHITEGPIVDRCKAMAEELFKGKITAKGALIITPEKVIVTTPGPGNNKVL